MMRVMESTGGVEILQEVLCFEVFALGRGVIQKQR